jgi:hypothetical protein
MVLDSIEPNTDVVSSPFLASLIVYNQGFTEVVLHPVVNLFSDRPDGVSKSLCNMSHVLGQFSGVVSEKHAEVFFNKRHLYVDEPVDFVNKSLVLVFKSLDDSVVKHVAKLSGRFIEPINEVV